MRGGVRPNTGRPRGEAKERIYVPIEIAGWLMEKVDGIYVNCERLKEIIRKEEADAERSRARL